MPVTVSASTYESDDFTIRFPNGSGTHDQDEEWFYLETASSTRKVRTHDYSDLYATPGLYEALVYDTLACRSHECVANLLRCVLQQQADDPRDMSVLDLGAGNGVVGAKLKELGIGTIKGLDLIEEARTAADRDRPGVYDAYYVTDLTKANSLAGQRFDGLTVVAALGFGDIPTKAFVRSANLVRPGGWIALTIKKDFLDDRDQTGFGALIRDMIDKGFAQLDAYQHFRHRVSIGGDDIYYAALVLNKLRDYPDETTPRAAKHRRNEAAAAILPGAF